jgi:hypothetical protein
MKDLKKRWSSDKLYFGQNGKYFIGQFISRITNFIPDIVIDPGRQGKGEAKLKCAILLTDEMIIKRDKKNE